MQVVDDIIFINGKAKYKKEGRMLRENFIMKISDNKVIDAYRMFNIVYYDFLIKKFKDINYFIVVGFSVNEFNVNNTKKVYMFTSIKIYDATIFLKEKENNNISPAEETYQGEELYPESLTKQIRILKNSSNEELACDVEVEKMGLYESFQNINSFSISDDFKYAAISIDGMKIILIYGYPNLLECEYKEIKMIFLQKIMYGDREVNITNLAFTILNLQNEMTRILYATTGNLICYYIWKDDIDKGNNLENNIQLRELSQERIGVDSGCISVKGSSLLIGSKNGNFIGEYNYLEFGKTWFFDGQKTYVDYFNEYILFVIFGEVDSYLEIYDRKNQFFVYYQADKKKIIGISHDNIYIYVLYESLNQKYIVKLKEKNNKDKFETFFLKKFFDDAVLYAENLGYDKKKIAEISKKHAEYEYSKGNYEKSIEQYIKTINYYEPPMVIQKFLEKSKLNYLIKYLEVIIYNMDFKIKDLEENKNYTTLLLHCYIMQEEIDKMKDFLDKKRHFFSKEIIKTIIDVCVETENIDMGLSISKEYKMMNQYLQILIINLNNYEEAINLLEEPEKNEFDNITNDDKIKLYLKFQEYFMKAEEGIIDKYFNSIIDFINNNYNKNVKNIDKKDILKLIEIFIDSDKYFKKIFELMDSYDLEYNKEWIYRRIQLYLDDLEIDKKNISYKKSIIEIIKNEKYIDKYDSQYLLMLFKNKHFLEGIEVLSEIHKFYQDLLFIYMEKREYEKIINLCKNHGMQELSFWGTSLNYFISKDNRKDLNKKEIELLNNSLEIFLQKLFDSKIISPVNVLDIIYEKNNDIPYYILNKFMSKSLENEIKSINEEETRYSEFDKKIDLTVNEIKELKTKAYIFNLIKCCECDQDIDLPFIAFKCGHGFHSSCLNSTPTEDTQCPKCKDSKLSIRKEIQNYKVFSNDINTIEKLDKELSQKVEKIDFIYELYGKGLFNLGRLKENNK